MQRRKSFFGWLTAWLLLSMLGVGILGGAGLSVRAAPLRATQGNVIISEVAWGGTIASDEDEWIELLNPGPFDVSLDQWRITSKPLPFGTTPNIDITISDTTPLLIDEYYLLEREIDTVIDNKTANQIYSGPGNLLDDGGETLYLYAPNGSGGYDLIDSINSNGGEWPAGLPSGYGSMERYDDQYYPDSDALWVTNVTQDPFLSVDYRGNLIRGTPKMKNSASLPATTTTLITSSDPDPSIPNLPVKVNVSVTGGPTIPEGTVYITGANTNCQITLSNGSGSCNVIFSSVGTKTLTATYDPKSEHTASIDTDQHDVVTAISTTTTITNLSPTIAFINEDVTVSVKVDPMSGSNIPTGTVNITGANTNCQITLSNGAGGCKVNFSSVGVKTLTATYLGFGAFTTSKDTETIDAFFPSTTTITADNPDPSVTNQQVTVSVSVTGGSSSVPTGSVDITGASSNCSLVLSNEGKGSCLLNFSSSGTKTLRATYNGDGIYYDSVDTEAHTVSFSSSSSGGTGGTSGTGGTAPKPLLGISEFLPRPGHDWNNDGYVDVFDEFIEIINAGSIDVNLSAYKLDDEINLGSSPYSLPNITLKPGERAVFYAAETGILLSDAGDTVRLLLGSKVIDAYTYGVVRYPDQSWCRIPDRLGYWNKPCFPTPNNPNALTGTLPLPPQAEAGYRAPVCLLPDTTPEVFVYAECESSGKAIWNRQYWDRLDVAKQRKLYEPLKWETFFE